MLKYVLHVRKTINKLFEVRNNHHGFIYID